MKEKIVLEVTEDDNVTISEMSITGENFLYSIVCLVRYLLFNVTEKAVRGGADTEEIAKLLHMTRESLKSMINTAVKEVEGVNLKNITDTTEKSMEKEEWIN